MNTSTGGYIVSTDVLSQEVNGEIVLLDLKAETYYGLDPVGAAAWKLIGEGHGRDGVVEAMLQAYDVERSRLETDIDALLAGLLAAGLIREA